jgi:hypothetical protein
VTGSTFFNPELAAKRFELLKETLPGLTEVGLLLNPGNPINEPIVPIMIELTAKALGLEVLLFGGPQSRRVRRRVRGNGSDLRLSAILATGCPSVSLCLPTRIVPHQWSPEG